ncbi:FCD domain-containing protein [Roseibium salinum]|nr:FCD domain-containing protein [Roseibium salinum]
MAALRALNRRIFDCYDRADALDLFEIDMEFHTVIARASHNAALAETHRAYLARLWRARFLSASQRRNRDRVIGHHAAILDALEARDADAVRVAIERHLGNLAEDIRLVIEKEESSPPTV